MNYRSSVKQSTLFVPRYYGDAVKVDPATYVAAPTNRGPAKPKQPSKDSPAYRDLARAASRLHARALKLWTNARTDKAEANAERMLAEASEMRLLASYCL